MEPSTTTVPTSMEKYTGFCYPNVKRVEGLNTYTIGKEFEQFAREMMAKYFTEETASHPADPYWYNSNMGEFSRKMPICKDAFVAAVLASQVRRNSCKKK